MDYSASNTALWNVIVQLGMIAGVILLGNFLRQKISFIRRSMMPVAVLGGFLLLIAKYTGILRLDGALMEMLVYHGIALGFIAMSLRVPPKREEGTRDHSGLRSGRHRPADYPGPVLYRSARSLQGLRPSAAHGLRPGPRPGEQCGLQL